MHAWTGIALMEGGGLTRVAGRADLGLGQAALVVDGVPEVADLYERVPARLHTLQ